MGVTQAIHFCSASQTPKNSMASTERNARALCSNIDANLSSVNSGHNRHACAHTLTNTHKESDNVCATTEALPGKGNFPYTHSRCCPIKTKTDKCWLFALIDFFTLPFQTLFWLCLFIEFLLIQNSVKMSLKKISGCFSKPVKPCSTLLNTKLLSVGQQHHWSGGGLGALFKDTWIVENKGWVRERERERDGWMDR